MATLPRITSNGANLIAPSGEPGTLVGISDFSLFGLFLDGKDIEATLKDRQSALAEVKQIAANTGDGRNIIPIVRVFFMVDSFYRLRPQERSNFWSSIRPFAGLVADFGFWTQAEVFADAQIIMPKVSDRIAHWQQWCAVISGDSNIWTSKGNEAPKNGFDPLELPGVPDGMWSQGSQLTDGNPTMPSGDWTQFHGNRTSGLRGYQAASDLAFVIHGWDENPAGWSGTHKVAVLDEWLGADEVNDPGRRSNDTRAFYRAGADAALWGGGMIFHSTDGVSSQPFRPVTRACALANFMGLAKVDPVQRYQG